MTRITLFFSFFLAALSAQAVDKIDKQVVVDFLNGRRAAYLSGDPSDLIKTAATDISVTMISSVVEGPGGTRQMKLPQYVPFLKKSFANTEYMAYTFKKVNGQFADDGQSAKVYVDIQEKARVQGLPVTADKALVFALEIQNGQVKVTSLTEKIESVQAGGQYGSSLVESSAPNQSSAGSGQSAVNIGGE
ncbi:MAG: hypothetical protein ACQKBV_11300 [Puniceicoccales bacterium]